ncbi:hypothetical protein D3C73_1197700 [compost metagenome]
MNFGGKIGFRNLRIQHNSIHIVVAHNHAALAVYAGGQQHSRSLDRIGLAKQGDHGIQTVNTEIHKSAIRELRLEGVHHLSLQKGVIPRGILTVSRKITADPPKLVQVVADHPKVRHKRRFHRFHEQHVMAARRFDHALHLGTIGSCRLLAEHMLAVGHQANCLLGMQGIRACDIDGINLVALRHLLQIRIDGGAGILGGE